MIYDSHEPSRLNRITEQLLKQGHTKDKTPPGMKDWHFFYGGWTFSSETLQDMTFETPCGLLVRGSRFTMGSMSYMGVDWIPENDNPTITCPYFDRTECSLVHELLRGHTTGIEGKEKLHFCNCHLSERIYSYDHSLDKAYDDVWREAETLWQSFSDARHGRVCKQHAAYNRTTKQWSIHYDPFVCAQGHCAGRHCPVLDREISDRKANIYFDVKTIWTDEGVGMFPDVEKVRIEKGIRLLERQVSETICGAIVKYANVAEHIRFRRGWDNLKFRLSGVRHKVVNVRVECRECRDLQQDLHDIAAGIEVIHASDKAAAAKAQKSERRRKAAASRVTKLEKLVREKGYDGLETVEQYRADKYLSADRICELEEERLKPPPIDTQISFFINDGNFETDIVKLGKGCQICKTEHLSK